VITVRCSSRRLSTASARNLRRLSYSSTRWCRAYRTRNRSAFVFPAVSQTTALLIAYCKCLQQSYRFIDRLLTFVCECSDTAGKPAVAAAFDDPSLQPKSPQDVRRLTRAALPSSHAATSCAYVGGGAVGLRLIGNMSVVRCRRRRLRLARWKPTWLPFSAASRRSVRTTRLRCRHGCR
jgi:hypothetical protein